MTELSILKNHHRELSHIMEGYLNNNEQVKEAIKIYQECRIATDNSVRCKLIQLAESYIGKDPEARQALKCYNHIIFLEERIMSLQTIESEELVCTK